MTLFEKERVVKATEAFVDMLRAFRNGDKSGDLGAVIARLELTVNQLQEAKRKNGRNGDAICPAEYPLLSLFHAHRGDPLKYPRKGTAKPRVIEGRPTEKEVTRWAVEVIQAAMNYYDAEVADCNDPDCPVCVTMIELGRVLGHLVIYPEDRYADPSTWKRAIRTRLDRIQRDLAA